MTKDSISPLQSLKNADWLHTNATQTVLTALNKEGFLSRVVGGAVRNTLLQHPVKDIDIASSAPPETSMRLAKEAGLKVIPTGLQHGTITIVSQNIPYEVTTLRKDVETDGRHATVAFTEDWNADASRRDFTMNALYVDADGKLYDPLDGYQDLMAKKVRFIGDPTQRIREDYLRILRYFRFKAEYGLDTLDQHSLNACIREKDGMRTLSAERISSELLRLLQSPSALPVIHLMHASGLLAELLSAAPNPARFKKLLELDKTLHRHSSPMLKLTALALYTTSDVERFSKRFRLSNENKKALTAILQHKKNYSCLSSQQIKTEIYKNGSQAFKDQLVFAWTLSQDPASDTRWKKQYVIPDKWTPPVFPLKGRDLLDIGFSNGPEIGITLQYLEKIWIKSEFTLTTSRLTQLARKERVKNKSL